MVLRMVDKKVRADEIKHALSVKHQDDFFLTEVKNGPTHTSSDLYIMDAIAIKKSWANPLITGYEIKVSRNDFMQDEKWLAYKNYCHRLDFVVPKGLIKPDELPDEIGLIYYNPETESLYTRRKGRIRNIETPSDMLMYIIMNRLKNQQHPFFTDKREYFEAYVQNEIDTQALAQKVSSKLIREVEFYEIENKNLKRTNQNLKFYQDIIYEIQKVLKKHNLKSHYIRGFAESIDIALSEKAPSNLAKELEYAKNVIDRLYGNLVQE